MSESVVKLIVRAVLSCGLMAGGLFILIDNTIDNAELDKAATSWIGFVIGYWLR